MEFNFDLISDLNLTATDRFDWSGKSTSIYCIVAGNISRDARIVHQTLTHLGTCYKAVFYIDGGREHNDVADYAKKIKQLSKICEDCKNVTYLHNKVIIVSNVAILGCNGWYGNMDYDDEDTVHHDCYRSEDTEYLTHAIDTLGRHSMVRKIVIVSNSVPSEEFFFGSSSNISDELGTKICLLADTESKVSHWLYGSSDVTNDTIIDGIHYINNACHSTSPYYAKMVTVNI